MMPEIIKNNLPLKEGDLFDASKNFMGGHAIVGAQIPLAAGFALASQYRKEDSVTMVYFGDGATNQGTFHETMNLASV